MPRDQNPLLKDVEACDLLCQLIHWGYDKVQIMHAYDELENLDWDASDDRDF